MAESVSIIIPSLNSPIIDEVVARVLAQDAASLACVLEIIIVGMDVPQKVPTHALVTFVDTGEPISAGAARNVGIERARGDILLFLDSDCLPLAGWLVGHLRSQAAGKLVVGGGVAVESVECGSAETVSQKYWHLSYNLTIFHECLTTTRAGARDFLPTLNLSIARAVIDEVGGLDGRYKRAEDVDWTTRMRRAGFQPYFNPSAAVQHLHNRTTAKQLWRDCARSAFETRQIRLENKDILPAPSFLAYPSLTRALMPAMAVVATGRVVGRNPKLFQRHWRTIPAIFLSKLAWGWGAGATTEPQ